jgi:DNA-binding transcriptional MerR regulator
MLHKYKGKKDKDKCFLIKRITHSGYPLRLSGLLAILIAFSYHSTSFYHEPNDEDVMKSTGIKKLYYSISEVSKITDLEQYVLRYWESEFEQLKPAKNRAGNRIYTNKDIKLILYIRQLLREERYTIEGAKQVLKSWTPEVETGEQLQLLPVEPQPNQSAASSAALVSAASDAKLKEDLLDVKGFLEELLVKLS